MSSQSNYHPYKSASPYRRPDFRQSTSRQQDQRHYQEPRPYQQNPPYYNRDDTPRRPREVPQTRVISQDRPEEVPKEPIRYPGNSRASYESSASHVATKSPAFRVTIVPSVIEEKPISSTSSYGAKPMQLSKPVEALAEQLPSTPSQYPTSRSATSSSSTSAPISSSFKSSFERGRNLSSSSSSSSSLRSSRPSHHEQRRSTSRPPFRRFAYLDNAKRLITPETSFICINRPLSDHERAKLRRCLRELSDLKFGEEINLIWECTRPELSHMLDDPNLLNGLPSFNNRDVKSKTDCYVSRNDTEKRRPPIEEPSFDDIIRTPLNESASKESKEQPSTMPPPPVTTNYSEPPASPARSPSPSPSCNFYYNYDDACSETKEEVSVNNSTTAITTSTKDASDVKLSVHPPSTFQLPFESSVPTYPEREMTLEELISCESPSLSDFEDDIELFSQQLEDDNASDAENMDEDDICHKRRGV